jgi:NAD(P)-dependent dehydrogenase (short-subunit alcohol dehydrogenase family)
MHQTSNCDCGKSKPVVDVHCILKKTVMKQQAEANSTRHDGPVALITGGAVRIGRAISRRLALTHRVAVHCNGSESAGRELIAILRDSGYSAALFRADLCVPGSCGPLLDEVLSTFGRLDVLVNNAALWCDDTADLMMLARMKSLNIDAPLRLIQAALPHLRANRGNIVNISDIAGIAQFTKSVSYSRTRAALLRETSGMTLALAESGVRINTVCPGTVLFAAPVDDEARRRIREGIPLRRIGTPEEIADLVAFLAGADFITGQIIAVDGGRLLRCGEEKTNRGVT